MPSDSVSSSMPAARIVSKSAGRAQEHRALRLEIRRRFGNRHQPAQPQTWQRRDSPRQRQRLFGRHARLVGAAVHVHLQAHLQRRQCGRPLLGQPLGDLQPVDAVHPVEVLGHRPRLVALQRADAVPFEFAAQIGQRLDLGDRPPARSSRRRRSAPRRGPRAPPRPGRSWTPQASARSPDRGRRPCMPSRSGPELAGACRQSSS